MASGRALASGFVAFVDRRRMCRDRPRRRRRPPRHRPGRSSRQPRLSPASSGPGAIARHSPSRARHPRANRPKSTGRSTARSDPCSSHPSATADTSPAPLVIALHGYGGFGMELERLSELSDAADERGWTVIYPEGLGQPQAWSYDRAQLDHAADIAFLRTIVDDMVEAGCVDAERVVVTGISQGGWLADMAGCEMPDVVTGVVSVASHDFGWPCEPASPSRSPPSAASWTTSFRGTVARSMPRRRSTRSAPWTTGSPSGQRFVRARAPPRRPGSRPTWSASTGRAARLRCPCIASRTAATRGRAGAASSPSTTSCP